MKPILNAILACCFSFLVEVLDTGLLSVKSVFLAIFTSDKEHRSKENTSFLGVWSERYC